MSPTSKTIAVFASGNGSNLQAIIDAIHNKTLDAKIAVVLSDQNNAYALTRATTHHIPTLIVQKHSTETRDAHTARIVEALTPYSASLICLAGYMRIIGAPLLEAYPNRIINIHPSLLPAYPGLHSIERAFADHVRETGCTIHRVDSGMDTGTILAQTRVPILSNDTLDTLTARIHDAEHVLYPATIQKILNPISAS